MERTVKMALALLIIIILTAVIVYATLPFLNYFFGSFILYVIFRPLYRFFVRKARIRKQFASVLVIIISIFVVLIPLYFLLNVIIGEIQQLLLEQATIVAYIQSNAQFLTHYLSMLIFLPTLSKRRYRKKLWILALEPSITQARSSWVLSRT